MPFNRNPRFVQDGDSVRAAETTSAPRTIQQNVEYVLALLEAAELNGSVLARDQTMSSDLLVGQPCYYNTVTEQFEKALAGSQVDSVTGQLVPTEASTVFGVVSSKTNSTLGHILLGGYVPLDLANAVSGTVAAGWYFLSGVTAGRLTRQRPFAGIPVLWADGAGNVLVRPQFKDLATEHAHFGFDLAAVPAGQVSPPSPGDPHEITSSDITISGWLPADDASFEGHAPVGARFGYNLNGEGSEFLKSLWPPLPIQSGWLELDRGDDAEQGYHGVPLGTNGLAVINRYGIWWMSNCYGDVPWPTALDTSSEESVASANSEDQECPRDQQMRLRLWFNRPAFATDAAFVTSLQSSDTRLLVRCAEDTELPATTGNLVLSLDFSASILNDNEDGDLVFKDIDDQGRFKRGPVVKAIRAGTNITLTSTIGSDDTDKQGTVTISAAIGANQELPVRSVQLQGVEDDLYKGVPTLRFRASRTSSLIGIVKVPDSTGLDTPKLRLRFWLLGSSAGTLPTLTLTTRKLPRPNDGLTTPETLVLSDSALGLVTAAAVGADEYVEATSSELSVTAGDVVMFTLSRSSADGYAGHVSLLEQTANLASE